VTSTSRLARGRQPAGRVPRAPRVPAEDFRTPVRGHVFAARPPSVPAPTPGAPAALVREPDNPRDPLAVAVWTTGECTWRIGYLDRTVAARLAPRLDAGQRFLAELAGWVEAPGARWRRPLLRVRTDGPDDPPPPPGGRDGLWGRPPGSSRRVVTPGR
jgi:hypothetical protein